MDAEGMKKYEEAVRDVIGMHAIVLGRGGAGYVEFDAWLAAHDAEVRAQVVVEEPEWEPSAQDLLDAIYNPDEDSENHSVRYGYILEQLERLRGKR